MCCDADWKREVVPDHKFDFINVREFRKTDCMTRLKYIWRYILLLKSFAVYGLDIFTATTLILSNHWTNVVQSKCGDDCAVQVKFDIAKWVFVGCIIFSFLLLGYETYKAQRVIASRDISYAFTNLLANDYYSFKNYDNFCLFCQIDSSSKKKDDFAFFIFFAFKEWKRLLLADGPRQSINALLLYSFAAAFGFQTNDLPAYWEGSPVTAMLLFSMIATVLIFAGSLVLLIAAAVLYVPLLCYIQGNLKEYVCHKVDKRISELIKKKQRERSKKAAALERKMATDGIRNSKGELVKGDLLRPTLPNVKLDDEDLGFSGGTRRKAEKAGIDLATTPGGYEYESYGGYPPSLDYAAPQKGGFYQQEGYGSSSGLAAAAAPMGLSYPPAAASQASLPSYTSNSLVPSYPPSSGPSFPPRSNSNLSAYATPPPRTFTPPPPSSPYGDQRPLPGHLNLRSSDAYHHHGEQVISPSVMSNYSHSTSTSGMYDRRRSGGLAYDDHNSSQPPAYGGGGGGGWRA